MQIKCLCMLGVEIYYVGKFIRYVYWSRALNLGCSGKKLPILWVEVAFVRQCWSLRNCFKVQYVPQPTLYSSKHFIVSSIANLAVKTSDKYLSFLISSWSLEYPGVFTVKSAQNSNVTRNHQSAKLNIINDVKRTFRNSNGCKIRL